MSSIDHNELFEQYYQNEYDFNTASLSTDEIIDIKRLAREKRVDYALAPMGVNVFNWILKQNRNIRFESVSFDSEKIDGMLYIPTTGKERAYIILNTNKPLINQIFTAVHEFYHYVKDERMQGRGGDSVAGGGVSPGSTGLFSCNENHKYESNGF